MGITLKRKLIILLSVLFLYSSSSYARGNKYFAPAAREHSAGEIALDAGFLYGIHWAGDLIMFKVLSDAGGDFDTYKKNFFMKNIRIWDGDSFYWNFIGHPYVGSQTYLYYRARGYGKWHSFLGSFTASFLFESTIEISHESFSLNDSIITPGFGFLIGNFVEKISLEMINSDSEFKKVIAKIINPSLNFKYYEGVTVIPVISKEAIGGQFLYRFN